ncbi:MAG TPA: EcsC family protein [Bacilli bacterium]
MGNSGAYERMVAAELQAWRKRLLQRPGILERSAKLLNHWTNRVIPERIQQILTTGVKGMVHASLFTAKFLPGNPIAGGKTLEEKDAHAKAVISRYKRVASAEGAGTGAGGLLLGLADFPALLAIKMKMLFELAGHYGFRADDARERVFLLYVFQLAFSGYEHRLKVLERIEHWQETADGLPSGQAFYDEINWRDFQQEYRDAIDFRKMLQLVPGIGAAVGAWANYNLVEDLGETAMNCYRMRILRQRAPAE